MSIPAMGQSARAERPIGIFDSGIGGLTVANAVSRLLPQERIIYFGDTAHLPYGDKSADAIRYYCLRIGKFLLEHNCKMIVVACNSASTAGYDVLLDFFRDQALFVNVVDPLVQEVARYPFHKVGIIATKATIHSAVYQKQLQRLQSGMQVAAVPTPLLAPMIEEGFVHNRVSKAVLDAYLSEPALKGMDALLLACTHYPLIRQDIASYYGPEVAIFDATDVVAHTVRDRLADAGLLSPRKAGTHAFYVSDHTAAFESATRLFYGEKLHLEPYPLWT